MSGWGDEWQRRPTRSQSASYHGYRFPPDIISHAVRLYYRFCLSFHDAEDLLAQRGVTITYETIRQWRQRFGPVYARQLRRFTSAAHVQRRRPARTAVCRIPCLIPCLAYVERTRMARPGSDLLEVPGGVLVQQARDQGLVRQPLGQRALLDRLQIPAR